MVKQKKWSLEGTCVILADILWFWFKNKNKKGIIPLNYKPGSDVNRTVEHRLNLMIWKHIMETSPGFDSYYNNIIFTDASEQFEEPSERYRYSEA